MKTKFDELRDKYRSFYDSVSKGHNESKRPHRGHGLDHDVTVAMLAVDVAPDAVTSEKAWCASMLHSTDRIVEKNDNMTSFMAAVEAAMREHSIHLSGCFYTKDVEEIVQAALRHGEFNQDDQSPTQMVIMDADRLANLMPAVVIRAGQFQPGIPAFEFRFLNGVRNPGSTYYEPKSVLDDLRTNIAEYIPKLRVPGAIELGQKYKVQLEAFITDLEQSYHELGLVGIEL